MNRIRILLLALAAVLWTSLTSASDPNVYWGSPSSGKPAAILSTVFHIDNTGVTDSGSAQVGAWSSLSRSGQVAFYSAGTYLDSTSTYFPSNLTIQLGPAVIIHQQLPAGAHTYPSTAWLYNVGTRATGSGVVNTAPTLYTSLSLLVSGWTGGAPTVGQYLNIAAVPGASLGGNATYLLTGVTNTGAGAYTLTVDRPFVWSFVANDVVTTWSDVPHDLWVDGGGGLASGTGDQLVEVARGRNVHLRDLRYDTSLGVLGSASSTGAVMGLDDGMISSSIEDVTADITGMTPAGAYSSGFYMQSDERSIFRRLRITGVPANGQGFSIMDSYSSGVEDSWAYGGDATAAGFGFYSLTGANGFPGSRNCWVRGGGAVGTGYGLIVQGGGTVASAALNNSISDWSAVGVVHDGIDVGVINAAYGTRISRVITQYAGGAGINIGAYAGTDTLVQGADVSHAGGGAGHNTVGALNVSGSGVVATIDGLTADITTGESMYGVFNQSSATMYLAHARISTAVSAAAGIISMGTLAEVSDSTVTTTGGGGATTYQVYAGTMVLHNDVAIGTGLGLYVNTGATAVLTGSNDFSATYPYEIVLSGTGTCSAAQRGGVTAANATAALNFEKLSLTNIESSGNASGTVAITAGTYSYCPGMEWTVRNNNTGTSTTTFFGITVAQGKSAIVRINSAGAGERVTPDT